MAKGVSQYAFNSGVLSPFLNGRTDIDRFAYGARTMNNFIPMLQGPARKRPGTKYVHDLKEKCWLMSVVFSQTDAWILAFGDSTLKFFTDRGPVVETATNITGITQASPGVVTSNSHGYSNGDEVYIQSVGGMTELNERFFIVRNKTTNTYELEDMWGAAVSTAAYTAYTSGGTAKRVYKIVSPYTTAALTETATGCCLISYAVSADVIYICVPGYQPRKLTRTSSTSWAFSTFSPTGGPFVGTDPDETVTVYASAATGSVTLTASSATWASTDVGSLFLLEKKLTEVTTSWEAAKAITTGDDRRSQGHYYDALNTATTGAVTPTHTEGSRFDGDTGVNWNYLDSGYGWATITAFGSSTSVTATVNSRFNAASIGAGNASTQWSQGAWSDTLGWPTHVCFFRERLWFARDTKLWGSVPSDFENFSERDAGVVADDSAISIDIRQGYNDDIQWLMPSADLLVGAQGNEFSVGEISTSDPLSPTNTGSLRGPGYGCRRVQPALINDAVMYALPSGRVLRELRYSYETDGYTALNRSAFAEHITKGQINRMAFAKEPESVLWQSCADGALIGMSYEREHQLLAWHNQTLGGAFSTGDPVVEDVAVIPSPTGDSDELYLCVKRTLNGATKHYLEYLAAHWDESSDDLDDQYYVDCGLSDEANASTTVGGLEHLRAASVRVLADGRDLGAFTVSSAGEITLTSATAPTVIHAGLSYTAELESMPLHRPGPLVRFASAFVRFVSTVFAKAGGSTTTDRDTRTAWGPREIGWTFSGYSIDAAMPAQTRIIRVPNEGGQGQEVFFKITHDFPTACTVAGWTLLEDDKR